MPLKHYDWRFYQRLTPQCDYYLALIYEEGCDWLRTLEIQDDGSDEITMRLDRIERPIAFDQLTILRKNKHLHYTTISSIEVPTELIDKATTYENAHQPQRLAIA